MGEQETLLERLARENDMTIDRMRDQLERKIRERLNNPDPRIRAQWEKIPCEGSVPTAEEYLRFVVVRIYEEGREDVLRRYLVD